MTYAPPILLARFKLNSEFLRDRGIAVLDFAWDAPIRKFIEHLEHARGKKLEHSEKPPYRSLNTTLTALAPTLVHGFEGSAGKFQMMVFQELDHPSEEQVSWVVKEWAVHWVMKKFGEFITKGHDDLLRAFVHDLLNTNPEWREIGVSSIWQRQDQLVYTAIPSLLAAHLAGKSSTIMDANVTWRLSQHRDRGLIAVSDPQQSSFLRPTKDDQDHMASGTFAYALQFRVQNQAGNPEPWIHVFASCRRYVDKPLKKSNFGRRISIMMGINTPRLNGWMTSPTLIPAFALGGNPARWADSTPEILDSLGARVPTDPKLILANPSDYRSPSSNQPDEYYVIYAEGMSPHHTLKAGLSVKEKASAFAAASEALQGVLIPDTPIERDALNLNPRPIAMLDPGELADKRPVRMTSSMTETEHERRNLTQIQEWKVESNLRATSDRPVQLMVVWHNTATRGLVLDAIRNFYSLQPDQAWPAGIEVKVIKAAEELVSPLAIGNINPSDRFRTGLKSRERKQAWKAWNNQLKVARRQRIIEWIKFFKNNTLSNAYNLALIETEDSEDDHERDRESRSIKSAVREAAVREAVGTQMIKPIVPGDEDKGESKGRAKNAVADLLMRQIGAMYGSPTEIYAAAGLPDGVANRLIVVGMCRVRHTKENLLDYCMAVRLLPNGRIEARLPHTSHWQPYIDATLEIGRHILQHRSGTGRLRSDQLRMTETQLAKFAYDIVNEDMGAPTLIMLMADEWRGKVWPQMNNPSMVADTLDFSKVNGLGVREKITPRHRPGLRVVRLRESGTSGETPQYVATADADWSEIEEVKAVRRAAGLIDTQASNKFFHYLSIAEMPQTASYQKIDSPKRGKGGGESFSAQSIVEIVPFFLQPEDRDNPLPWARIPHLLRFSFAWGGGGIVAPSPIHLGYAAIEDQICLLETNELIEDEEEEEEIE